MSVPYKPPNCRTRPRNIQPRGWLSSRRAEYLKGTLSPERIAALEELGLVWDPHEQWWQEGLTACRGWIAEHGSLVTATRTAKLGSFNLGSWLGTRRSEYQRGTLSQDRIAALEELGMVWNPRR